MIVVVSLNPSIDRTLTLSEFAPGRTNRVRAGDVRVDAGGKGVNVCLHLRALGAEDVHCVGLMRKADEAMFTDALSAAGVHCHWLTLPGHVRTNTKVCTADGGLTEINEAGEAIPPAALWQMMDICREQFAQADVVVVTGSIPPGVKKRIYAGLIALAHGMGKKCLLDADGLVLQLGVDAGPDFIKPNRAELEQLLGRKLPDMESLMHASDELLAMGIAQGCISLGEDGAVFFSQNGFFSMAALDVPVRSTVGAGDAMMAAFALGISREKDMAEAFCMAMAAGAAAVSMPGTQPVNSQTVQQLMGAAREQLHKW